MQSSVKKHARQMTAAEKNLLQESVKDKQWQFHPHAKAKMEERGGIKEDILDVIENGSIVEYHQRNFMNRILFRGKKAIGKWVPCAVVEPTTSTIITVYWNHVDDHHRTINMKVYNKSIDILTMYFQEGEAS